MRSRIPGTALATLVLIASAYADAIFTVPSNVGGVHPVVETIGTGMAVFGRTSTGAGGHSVEFSSTIDTLIGSGSVPYVASTSGAIHNLTISVPGFSFLTTVMRPVPLFDNTIMVSATMSDGTTVTCPPGTCPFGTAGSASQIRIAGTNGERIVSVRITSTTGSFENLAQIWFGGASNEFAPIPPPPPPPPIIPEPSTLLTFGTGLIALGGMMRHKLKLGT